jgi:uncharacterized protein (TIGR02145 family)
VKIWLSFTLKITKMKVRFLPFLMLPILGMAQANSNGEVPLGGNISSEKQPLEINRNASFNLEEIKVRWKKAALENCTGVPCVVTPPAPSFTCGTSTISDVDNNVYETVSFGNQCWTKQNLKVSKYNDMTAIPLDASAADGSSGSWPAWQSGAYTIYGNVSSASTNATNYGFLYNWYAAAGINTHMGSPTKNICPTGWHVPTDSDWNKLVIFVDPSVDTTFSLLGSTQTTQAGTVLKKKDALWTPKNIGTDDYGFSALPGGLRLPDGQFLDIGNLTWFWNATALDDGNAWYRDINNDNGGMNRNSDSKSHGFSVRCLKD